MRQRILKTMIASLMAMIVLLGVPLTALTWVWISESARQDLSTRLLTVSEHVLSEEAAGRLAGPEDLDLEQFHLLLPRNGRLTLDSPAGPQSIGGEIDGARLSESVALGSGATLTLSIPQSDVRPTQWLAVGVLAVVMLGAVGGGALVAVLTARRLTEPLTQVAGRAAAMGRGDLSTAWPQYGIDELDRVSAALARANAEITQRLERERQIIGDVSHQLRSRLTAIHLRLDELTLHPDPEVVAEAEAGVDQVERLAAELDELVIASREETVPQTDIDVQAVVRTLVADFAPAYAAAGRRLRARFDGPSVPVAGQPGRLREALSVLIDNALNHGAGTTTVRVDQLPSAEMVRVRVSDEGAGVPDELADGIFRRGVSGDRRTGVGLSLARALIEADGGRLDLTSRRPPVFAIVAPAGGRGPDSGAIRRVRVPHR
ncbi:ATP-binding protein [Gordonia sp. VNK21]|uniref:ATP-binding protein n=1 Tax=Gordonia sp. VNK21 TaxID=3382483 RepID=UPI0038D4D714